MVCDGGILYETQGKIVGKTRIAASAAYGFLKRARINELSKRLNGGRETQSVNRYLDESKQVSSKNMRNR